LLLSAGSWLIDWRGALYARLSGGIASALGYAIWYAVLPNLKRSTAAVVQLSVPLLAALSGVVFLDEELTIRLIVAGSVIIIGIALVVGLKQPVKQERLTL
jgi:drug/metabolite transporter (DMT)-like permease